MIEGGSHVAIGHGKVILLGEHAVVYGRPALAAAIGLGARATAERADHDVLTIAPWNVRVEPSVDPGAPELARAFAAVLAQYPEGRPTLSVAVDVELPGGAGLGCSAAIGVSVIGAIDDTLGVAREPRARADASLAWERVFHGNPSGIDGTMAACGGIAVFQRGQPLERVAPREPLRLIVGYGGEASSTRAMVESVARQRDRAPERVDQVLDGIAALVRNGRLAIEAGDHAALGKLFDLCQALLSSLMLSTTKLEEMCDAARRAGAFGAKLTGAGGGGCMIALVGDASAAPVREALAPLAAQIFDVEAGAP